MVAQYSFKAIGIVPSAKDFVDIVLSKTQRQTPTVIHKGSAINRIRQFYMRKVKFTQQSYHDKLSKILDDFPRLDDIHPFYSSLINVLFHRDHYKLALGQVNTARNLVDKITKDYVRLLKYGDSLYRCKTLKRAAMGRMCTLMRKQAQSLDYLERVRQHLARFPSIDPNTRTILVCGYPNVGKSSFINKVTRADVDVQPYAFTTKSLFVGHTDYKYLRWQVIDTPGILDRPLDERNTIEHLAIMALTHLRCAVLYVLDLSGSCGYSIQQQAALFHSIKPLFQNKPLIIACNKTDLQPLETLPEEERELLRHMQKEAATCGSTLLSTAGLTGEDCLFPMSTMTEENVTAVKNAACEKLLQSRVEQKMKNKKMGDVLNRIHVAEPRQRDHKPRPPIIPQAVLARQAHQAALARAQEEDGGPTGPPPEIQLHREKLEKELQEEGGGAGVYSGSLKKRYLLENDDWKEDIMPEIMDGHNIADFVDADILQRLEDLEREDEEREAEEAMLRQNEGEEMDVALGEEEAAALKAIRLKKRRFLEEHRLKKSTAESKPVMPRGVDRDRQFNVTRMRRDLSGMGVDPTAAIERIRSRSASRNPRVGRKRERSEAPIEGGGEGMEIDAGGENRAAKRLRSRSRSKSRAVVEAVPGEGYKDTAQKKAAIKMSRKAVTQRNREARQGEADRKIVNLRPKHLFAGKRGIGKTDRR
eukprot:TRINITY_DN18488_c0_g1_i1.p1 TRINITY_DN18488_c0_g1~~TRINITY_DN18488_c0_g1_i1.p1  ORF type:complete len:702 (-),score=149.59 TRINITY_DN18488_c0_g1_i1:723-2828(-)